MPNQFCPYFVPASLGGRARFRPSYSLNISQFFNSIAFEHLCMLLRAGVRAQALFEGAVEFCQPWLGNSARTAFLRKALRSFLSFCRQFMSPWLFSKSILRPVQGWIRPSMTGGTWAGNELARQSSHADMSFCELLGFSKVG